MKEEIFISLQPNNFKLEPTTIWSFPDRGSWATHSGKYRVLKKGKMCAVMIGDIRKYGKVIPLGFRMMECFLQAGFSSKEIIIKEQHNCRSTEYWEKQNSNFLLLAHEYIFVFQK